MRRQSGKSYFYKLWLANKEKFIYMKIKWYDSKIFQDGFFATCRYISYHCNAVIKNEKRNSCSCIREIPILTKNSIQIIMQYYYYYAKNIDYKCGLYHDRRLPLLSWPIMVYIIDFLIVRCLAFLLSREWRFQFQFRRRHNFFFNFTKMLLVYFVL